MDILRSKTKDMFRNQITTDSNVSKLEGYIYKYSTRKYKKNTEKHYRNIVYQTINDLTNNVSLDTIIERIKNGKMGWNHTLFKDIQNKLDEQDSFIENPFEVEEGVQQCKAFNPISGTTCNSKRVIYYQRQERGADEPMTTYNTCYSCGASWKYSG